MEIREKRRKYVNLTCSGFEGVNTIITCNCRKRCEHTWMWNELFL